VIYFTNSRARREAIPLTRESHHPIISTRYIQLKDPVRQSAGIADGAFGGGRNLRHDTPAVGWRVSLNRSGFPEKTMHSLVTEQMPAERGRRPCPHRWGFVADSTPKLNGDIGGCVLAIRSSSYETQAFGGMLHRQLRPSDLSLGIVGSTPYGDRPLWSI